jgi:hypothetical protein
MRGCPSPEVAATQVEIDFRHWIRTQDEHGVTPEIDIRVVEKY